MSPFCSAFTKSNDNLVVHVRYVSVSVGSVVCLFVCENFQAYAMAKLG